jgi:hypothetical protein
MIKAGAEPNDDHLSRKRNSNLCTQTVPITSQLLLTLRLGTIHDTVNRRASMLVYEITYHNY